DVAGAQLLGFRRKAEARIDLSFGKKLHRSRSWAQNQIDILDGVKPNIGGHAGEERVLVDPQPLYAHLLALQIPNTADAFICKQFEAPDVYPGHHGDGLA